MYILSNQYGIVLTFLKVILIEPIIMLFISIKESTVKYLLPPETIKLLKIYTNVFLVFLMNISKLFLWD